MNKCLDSLINSSTKIAVFDIDNTITKSNIVDLYFFIKSKKISKKFFFNLWLLFFMAIHVPVYLLLDFINRDWFQILFYNKYKKYSIEQLYKYSKELFEISLKNKFIKDIHDLVFYCKTNGIQVFLLSTSIEPLVKQYAKYFNVPYKCLNIQIIRGLTRVDTSSLKNFKLNFISQFDPSTTISIADSKHDLSILKYTNTSIVVTKKIRRWMYKINNPIIILR